MHCSAFGNRSCPRLRARVRHMLLSVETFCIIFIRHHTQLSDKVPFPASPVDSIGLLYHPCQIVKQRRRSDIRLEHLWHQTLQVTVNIFRQGLLAREYGLLLAGTGLHQAMFQLKEAASL